MPVQWKGSISETIAALVAEGKSQEQAAAIAYDLGREHGVSKSFTDIELALPICKFDAEQQTVTGWAATSRDADGRPVIDWQGEYVPVDELEKVAHKLVAAGGRGAAGEMHERRSGDLVESMVVDKAKREALGFGAPPDNQPSEGWAVTLRLDDAAWTNYRAGKRPEMSMHGRAAMTPIGKRDGRTIYMRSDLQVDEISIVDRGASGNSRVQPRIVLAKRATEQERTMPEKKIEKTEALAELSKALELLNKAGIESLVELEGNKFSDEQKKIVYALLEAAKGGGVKVPPVEKPAPSPADAEKAKADAAMMAKKKADDEAKAKADSLAKAGDDPLAKALADLSPANRAAVEKALAEKSDTEGRVAMEKRHNDEKAELAKRVSDLEEMRKRLEADAELAEMTKRAELRPYVPGMSTPDQAKIMVKAKHALDKDAYEQLDKMLTAVDQGMRKSDMLKQIGSDKHGDAGSPAEKLSTMAKKLQEELRKSASGKRASYAKCYREVCEQNPELYAEATAADEQ